MSDDFQTIKYRTALLISKWDAEMLEWASRKLGKPPEEIGSLDMERLTTRPYAVQEVVGNILLDEGLNVVITNSFLGTLTTPTLPFNNTNAQIGVGDGTTAAVRTQLGLQGSNTNYQGMVATYPQIAAGSTVTTCTWRADFASGTAEWGGGWQEWSIRNGATADRNLNRKVENLGTGKSSQLWTADVTITLQG